MHICFITHEYPKNTFSHGGVGSFTKTLAPALVEKGFKVSVVGINYTNDSEHVIDNGINIYRLKPNKFFGLTWFLNAKSISSKIEQIHKTTPISIIEATELGLAFLPKINTIKYIIRLHGGHHFLTSPKQLSRWKVFQEKRSFKKADAFIAISKFIKLETEKKLSFHLKSVVQIYNPIGVHDFNEPDSFISTGFKIIFAGTVYEKKGIRQLIQSFGSVKKQIPEATLHIYGKDWHFSDGRSYTKMLQNDELSKLGEFAKDIFFYGAVPYEQISNVYLQASVCVFPSLIEAQGLVVLEAMAMEKVVVFTKFGVGPELIQNYENGLLCNPLQPEDIAEKIIWVFENQSKSEQIGRNARMSVIEKFDIQQIVHQNINFYKTTYNSLI